MSRWEKFFIYVIIAITVMCSNIQVVFTKDVNTNRTVSKVSFDKTIGINAFIDDPLSVMSVAGTVREYHNYSWTLDKANEHKFSPSYVKWWSFDDYYKKLHDAGITVMPCIQGTSSAVVNGLPSNQRNNKPINDDEDSQNPFSYSEHASTMYQYAARYGKVKVADDKLLLASDQPKLSGLGYIEYFENWNEPDKTWEGAKAHFSPYEMAAMTSADYDGHEGRLGDTYGIKNADPSAKLVLGGVANNGGYIEYLNGIREWSLNNRSDKMLPFDVLNFHMYVGKSSPEESNFIERLNEITAWRDLYASDKEVWLTEFGWDTSLKSPNGVSADNQRNFLMRSYLIANAHGIDRSTMYMIRDSGGDGKYGTSGLTGPKDNWSKKSSWYGVYTLKNVLTDFTFNEIVKEDNDIFIYKFINDSTKEVCFVLWSPTGNNSSIKNYKLNIGNNDKATITTFEDNSINGITTNLEITNKEVFVNVNETPTFIKVSKDESYVPLTFDMDVTSNKNNISEGDEFFINFGVKNIKLNSSKGLKKINGIIKYNSDLFDIDLDDILVSNNFSITKKERNSNGILINLSSSNYVSSDTLVFKVKAKVKNNVESTNTNIEFGSISGNDDNRLIDSGSVNLALRVVKNNGNNNATGDDNNNIGSNDNSNANSDEKIPHTSIDDNSNYNMVFDTLFGIFLISLFVVILFFNEKNKLG